MTPPFASRVLNAQVFVLSLALLAALWAVAAWAKGDPSVLPGPLEVLRIARDELLHGPMLHHIAATLRRVGLAFVLAMIAGTAIGAGLGLSRTADRWFGPWLTVFLNIPALVVIVLCYLWIGLNETAAVASVAIAKATMVAVNLREGVRSVDPGLAEFARSYRLTPLNRLRHIWLPQLWPFFASAMRNGLAIIWKLVLVVEFLGRGDGVGFQIHMYFQLFETGYVLAYAMSFVAVMLVIEYGLFRPLEARVGLWRRRSAAFA